MKGIIMLLGMMLQNIAASAQLHIVSHVADVRTGEALPFASVYVDSEKNTITNAEGDFVLDADSADAVRVSYVGYRTVSVDAGKIGDVVYLDRDGRMLDEVVVLGTEYVIKKVRSQIKKTLMEYDWKKTNYFYRQMGRCDRQCTSMVEAFFTGHSAVQTKDISLGTGRYVEVASSKTVTPRNFFTYMEVTLYSKYYTDDLHVPLSPNYKDNYDTDCRRINDGEHPVYVITFTPRDSMAWSAKTKLYVDAESFQPLRYEGVGQNEWVKNTVQGKSSEVPCDYSFVVHYQHDNGFIEVQSVHFDVSFTDEGKKYEATGTMFNTEKRYFKGKGKLHFEDDLKELISKRGLDRQFWQENEVVKRTPMEEEAVELFEGDNAFGVF